MRSNLVAEASCLYCADVLIPDVRACEACAQVESRITGKLRTGALDSPVQFCTAVVSRGTGLVCAECDRSWDVLRYFNPELRPGPLAASEARGDPETGQESEPTGG